MCVKKIVKEEYVRSLINRYLFSILQSENLSYVILA